MSERKAWLCEVDDEGLLILPDELLELQNWKEGDNIEFDILPDNTIILTKVEPNEAENNQGELNSEDGD
jgi:bifunctional DNA-binding transcriptional regulator/antitoxin component of YhaV-PrlF toxin-antitoxin module